MKKEENKAIGRIILFIIGLFLITFGTVVYKKIVYDIGYTYSTIFMFFGIGLLVLMELNYIYSCYTANDKIFDWKINKVISALISFLSLILAPLIVLPFYELGRLLITYFGSILALLKYLLEIIFAILLLFLTFLAFSTLVIGFVYLVFWIATLFVNGNKYIAIKIRGAENVKDTEEQIKKELKIKVLAYRRKKKK